MSENSGHTAAGDCFLTFAGTRAELVLRCRIAEERRREGRAVVAAFVPCQAPGCSHGVPLYGVADCEKFFAGKIRCPECASAEFARLHPAEKDRIFRENADFLARLSEAMRSAGTEKLDRLIAEFPDGAPLRQHGLPGAPHFQTRREDLPEADTPY